MLPILTITLRKWFAVLIASLRLARANSSIISFAFTGSGTDKVSHKKSG
ncbi:MAG: hypothetical protein O3A80_02055 [bacterium]|nr:hypothetical protein [bacterium]MDA1292162.1 hypothetical protein [bacterium]